jgi:hypothetical protein
LQKLGGKELKIRRATKENESRKRTKNTTKSTRPFPARNGPRKKQNRPEFFSEAVTGFGTLHRQAAEAKGPSASGC